MTSPKPAPATEPEAEPEVELNAGPASVVAPPPEDAAPERDDGPAAADPRLPDPDPSEVLGGVQVARIFGVPIYLQPGWLIVATLLITYVWQANVPEHVVGPARYALAFSVAVLLYVSVLVHELSHSVVALSFGMRVRRISLQLLGGVSEIEEEAPTPGKEFAIAFAGPALSFVLFGLGLLAGRALPDGSVAQWLAWAVAGTNLVVALFNLLPGLPLDGGRVLQAGIWRLSGSRHTGVVTAAWGGRVLAVLLLLAVPLLLMLGFDVDMISAVWMAVISAFLWVGAGSALRVARFRQRLPSLQARTLARRAVAVPAGTTVEAALRAAILGRAAGIVVVDDGTPSALVSELAVRAMPEDRRPEVAVENLARRLAPELVLPADIAGEQLLRSLQAAPATEYLLLETDGAIAGVLVADDVGRATAGW